MCTVLRVIQRLGYLTLGLLIRRALIHFGCIDPPTLWDTLHTVGALRGRVCKYMGTINTVLAAAAARGPRDCV